MNIYLLLFYIILSVSMCLSLFSYRSSFSLLCYPLFYSRYYSLTLFCCLSLSLSSPPLSLFLFFFFYPSSQFLLLIYPLSLLLLPFLFICRPLTSLCVCIDPLIHGSFGSSHAGIHTCLSLTHSSMEALVPPTLAFTHACHLWKLWFLPRWHSHMPVIYGSFGSSHAGIHTCLSSMEALVPPTLAFTHACH